MLDESTDRALGVAPIASSQPTPTTHGMTSLPLVSVIIPTRNRSALLKQAIESVLAVDHATFNLEVIVVDDGSTDDTAQVVAALPVTYLRANGAGVSAARNMGIDAAHGEFLAFIDDDDLWLPHNISVQLDVFDGHPEFGAVVAQTQLTDENRVPYGEPTPALPSSSGWLFEHFLGSSAQLGSVVVRRSVIESAGKMDPTIHAGEDWEWMLRIARKHQIGVVAQPVVLFRQRIRDEDAEWHNLQVALRTLNRHIRDQSIGAQVRMQRPIWRRRGWYAAFFLQAARTYMSTGDRSRALRCLCYSICASPFHTALLIPRLFRAGV